MSVDTYLKGKNLEPYHRAEQGGIDILVAPALLTWASAAIIDATTRLGRKRFTVRVDHAHRPT